MTLSGEQMNTLAQWNQSGESFRLNQLCDVSGFTSSHFGTSFRHDEAQIRFIFYILFSSSLCHLFVSALFLTIYRSSAILVSLNGVTRLEYDEKT
jgi:hypothetical protein